MTVITLEHLAKGSFFLGVFLFLKKIARKKLPEIRPCYTALSLGLARHTKKKMKEITETKSLEKNYIFLNSGG